MGPAPGASGIALLASALLLLAPFFIATVEAASPAKPSCSITRPDNGSTESGRLRVTGTAAMASDPIIRVQLRIDDGSVLIANGTESWYFDLDTTRMPNGPHSIEAKSFDGSRYSESVTVSFKVDKDRKSVV